jgi:hypothetical protein
MSRADVVRAARQLLAALVATHPALLMPALLLLAAMGALALLLLVAAVVALLALLMVGALVWPVLAGLNTLLGAVVAWQLRKAVAS